MPHSQERHSSIAAWIYVEQIMKLAHYGQAKRRDAEALVDQYFDRVEEVLHQIAPLGD
jgi:hypothetical protein